MSKINRTVLHESVPTVISHVTGGTIRTKNDWYLSTDGLYLWKGATPKDVQAGTIPEPVNTSNWERISDPMLRDSVLPKIQQLPVVASTITDLRKVDVQVGTVARTVGLYNSVTGGGGEYRIISSAGTRPEGLGYCVTEDPYASGDLLLDNGNIAKRLDSVTTVKTQYWAHRGGQRGFAENTMFAFQQAMLNGADGIEFDLSMSSDGVWHVYHDKSLNVLTDGTGYVHDQPSEYLQGLTFNKLKSTNYKEFIKIPTLAEFLVWARQNNVPFAAEFKHPRPNSIDADVRAGLKQIVDSGCANQCTVSVTTNVEALRVREISNDIRLLWSVSALTSQVLDLYKDYNNLIMMGWSTNLNESTLYTVRKLHNAGHIVSVFTDTSTDDVIQKCVEYGFDMIISDRGW